MSDLASLTALYDSARRIGLSDSLDQLLENILDQAQDLIGFDHCALMLYDAHTGRLSVRKVRGYGERAGTVLSLGLSRGEGLSGWAAEHRQAVRVSDVSGDSRYVTGLKECRSNLAVPLVVANEVAGVLNVESESLDAFTEAHEKLLTVLGSQAALAILASRARERLRQRIDQLNAVYRISQLASGQDDLDATLASILEVTEELIPDGHVALLLIDEASRSLVVRAARNYREGVELLQIPLGEGVTGRCALSGEVVVADDLAAEQNYIVGVEGARSEIAIPLKVEGRVIGVLNAESQTAHAYGEDRIRPLSVIAQQAAVVIRAAQLNEEARLLAVTDPLTGLHNRRYFVDKLEEHLARAARYGEELALVFVDSDHLKLINDRHGHLSGDRSLQAVAQVMRDALRSSDELARIGGDEFAALLLDAGPDRALAVSERLQRFVRGLGLTSDQGDLIPLTISIGVALFPSDGADAMSLLREADQALYRAKDRGRDRLALAGEKRAAGVEEEQEASADQAVENA
jgi:diguanylate cyclase (GGDEF)-like protein